MKATKSTVIFAVVIAALVLVFQYAPVCTMAQEQGRRLNPPNLSQQPSPRRLSRLFNRLDRTGGQAGRIQTC